MGYLLIGNPGNSVSPGTLAFHHSSATTVFREHSLKSPAVAENTSVLMERPEPQAASDKFSSLLFVCEAHNSHLSLAYGNKPADLNASLLVVVARMLGLSSLVLRE
ncbi:MAG TPA: hypothetical protein VFN35_00325 [Ktedonobacteraceae bacterium]|nr:hypothetical protein [Ktedonobacteraceae bacterium]